MSMVPAQDVADTFRLLRLPCIHIENSVSPTRLFQVRRRITFLFCSLHECTGETRERISLLLNGLNLVKSLDQFLAKSV